MLTTAFVLAACTVGCAVLIFVKLPNFLKQFLVKHDLMTDLFATVMVWIGLSSISRSIVAAMASAMSGVTISLLLYGKKKEVTKKWLTKSLRS